MTDSDGNGARPAVRRGARLRHAREQRRLSLAEVASRTGLSKGFLSRVERDQTSPSVASLLAVCEAVSLPMERLFATPPVSLVRAADRPQADLPGAAVVDTLITPPHEPRVTVLETLAAPGGSGGDELYSLPSECEVCYVLEGTIELDIEGATYRLERGDAMTFGAAVPHTWRNLEPDRSSRICWVIAPALPDPRSQAETPEGVSTGAPRAVPVTQTH